MDTQRTKISAFIYKLIGRAVGGGAGNGGGATHSGMRRVPDTRAPFSLQSTSRFYGESSPAAAVDISLDVSFTVTVSASVSALVAASLFALVSCTFHSIMFT